MKKSVLARLALSALVASVSLGLASCGGSDSSSETAAAESSASNESIESVSVASEDKAITGETKTWGVYTVLVPEGWKLREGDVLDDKDERYCSVKKSDFSYFDFKCETEEVQKMQYEYNKKTYTLNQKDIAATSFGGIEWQGFEYGNELNKGFELYGSSNGRFLRVSSCGFAFDSAETKAVLESLKVTAGDAPAESTAEAAESTAAAE